MQILKTKFNALKKQTRKKQNKTTNGTKTDVNSHDEIHLVLLKVDEARKQP